MFERDRSDDTTSGWWLWLSNLAPPHERGRDDAWAADAPPANAGRERRLRKPRRG